MDGSLILSAFKQIQVPLMIVGADGAIVHCNDMAHNVLGYDVDALIGQPVFGILPVTSVAELNAYIEPPAADAIIKRMVAQKKNGGSIPLSAHMTSWSDETGGLYHALILRDITDEMETARQTRAKLARADNAIKGARIGVFDFNPVTETVIVSDIWRELMGLSPSDDVDVQEEWRSRVHPDDLAMALEPIRLCSENLGERASSEHRVRSKDGTCWRWTRTDAAVANRDCEGRVISVIGATTDITERKTTENELRISVAQFKSAFDNATVGMATVGMDGAFRSVNLALCDLLGYTETDLLENNFELLAHPDDHVENMAMIDELKAGNVNSYRMERRCIRADNEIIWVLLSIGVVKDSDGNPEHIISQVVDVTEQRRLNQLKSEFISTVSHELRTPLTSVLGSLSLLSTLDDEPFSDDAQRLLFIAQENGKRLHALINDVLDFEKFSARQMRFTVAKHRIIGLVEEAVIANLATAQKFEVRYDIVCPDRSVTGFVDPDRFQQVMTNLLTNAVKFADKDSSIRLAVKAQKNEIRVSVTNHGSGIPDTFKDQIFKPFSQAATAGTRAMGGTGLGLNITKQIVEQTGGTIGFDSSEDGKTTFWFTVPITEPK
ncbi:PAS domain S-box-containing protein [Loktanella ponticola]|uniref:histidine kinase n=1 Tax=Yoonia ponticola TaxID=1524255 RepID=A0A7W9BMU1_9RHOB|nr:PAS domain-containing sensor histidine kinase [Yoonia ponticola]MBB5723242.1 PAS domain S-box-containing protein [Yoonia ponticola]